MSLTDLKHLRERSQEAGRLVDLSNRAIGQVLLKMNRAEFNKYGEQLNRALNLLDSAEKLLPKPKEESKNG